MDFATPYRLYMKEHVPALYADLRRTGELEETIQAAADGANRRFAEIIEDNDLADDRVGQQMAAEVVMAELLGTIDALRPAEDQPDPDIRRQMEAFERGDRVIEVPGALPQPHALLALNIAPTPPLPLSGRSAAEAATDEPEPVAELDAEAQRRWATDYANGLRAGFREAGLIKGPITPFRVGVLLAIVLLAGAWLAPNHTVEALAVMRPRLTAWAPAAGLWCVLGLLPAAFFARTRGLSARGFRLMSWFFALVLWVSAWDVTATHWGRGWATVGLVIVGAPILPMSVIAAAAKAEWSAAISIILLLAAWLGTWLAAARLDFLQEFAAVRDSILKAAPRP